MYNDRRDWRLRLSDIRDSAEKILQYVQGMDFDTFSQDQRTIGAVIRNFEIIGEAARHVPDEFKSSHPHIAWQETNRMRNRLIHAYFGVNVTVVWDTITNDLPPLLSDIRELVESHPYENDHD
jgi:uncharacterized protein with HEPN domain